MTVPEYLAHADGTIDITPRLGLLQRTSPTVSRVDALRTVHENLAFATVLLEHQGDGGRAGVWRAINDIVDYFSSRGIPMAALAPLTAVTDAIVDADRGIESPLFQPDKRKRGGAPPKSAQEIELDQYLAVIAECCVRHHRTAGRHDFLEPAMKEAAKIAGESPLPIKKTNTEIEKIRERIRQLAPGHSRRALYDDLLDNPIAKQSPLQWARLLAASDMLPRG